jgi:putative flippase GtrA
MVHERRAPEAELVATPGLATQAGRFVIVGMLNTATTFLIIAALRELAGAPVWLASGIGYAVATVQSYVLSRWWTFAASSAGASGGTQLLRFVAVNVVLALMFSGLNELLARQFRLMIATILTMVVVVPISFAAMRFLVFGRRRA